MQSIPARKIGNKHSPEVTKYKHYELEAFQIVVANCHKMICNQTILKLQNLAAIMKDHLHKNGLQITSSTKKNLRRNIEIHLEMT